MNDFEGLLSSGYGFKPQGKSAPMAPAKSASNNPLSNSNSSYNFEIGGSKTISSSSSPLFDDHDTLFRPSTRKTPKDDFGDLGFGDVFSGSNSKSTGAKAFSSSAMNLDSFFSVGAGNDSGPRFSSMPVFDKPVYDEDVSSSASYENIFSSSSSASIKKGDNTDAFDDLLGGLGKKESQTGGIGSKGGDKGIPAFDDLLPGFGGTTSSINKTSSAAAEKPSPVIDDPFVVLESTSKPATSSSGIFSDSLEQLGNLNNPGSNHVENSTRGAVFDDVDPLDSLGNSVPIFSAEMNSREKDEGIPRKGTTSSERPNSASGDASQKSSVRSPERVSEKKMAAKDYQESSENVFDIPSFATDSCKTVPNASSPTYDNASFKESNMRGHASPTSDENLSSSDDIWLTVSEIPLFTQPTAAPPPSRPPPPRPAWFSRAESGSVPASNAQKKVGEFPSFTSSVSSVWSTKAASRGVRDSFSSPVDELEDFVMGKNTSNVEDGVDVDSGEDFDTNSVAAAAMKEAVDRAEAKFRHARGVRERENAKASRSRENSQVEKEEKSSQVAQERAFREQQELREHEKQQREREEEERRRREEEARRRIEREQEEKEREKRRMERERELARQAVERAAREARERAAVEARTRVERAAVQKAQAEARERAERAAVQRAQAEARERAAAEAKERAEKVAVEARERARAEAREKEAREKAAAAARANQSKNENDLESFFSMGRASSAPKHRTVSSNPFDTQFQRKPAPESTRTSVNSSSSIRKASSASNIVDDLSSIFGGPPSAGEFQDVEGESEERRRARLERHQRTQERAAKALAEKNARDLEVQREQEERHRIAETLDAEIKRWAAGKEGNLRALLSTLQYVLWPGCGWQPVSLTDLITGASVKKVYRKATLCIHPDKVQQKGATLQQKYVAEKVFDLLKEAWNKFNSEELF